MAKPAKKSSRPTHKSPKKAPEETGGSHGKPRFDNTNRGVLFSQDKGDNEARPDYTGNAEIKVPEGLSAGKVFKLRIAGWLKTSQKSGETFLSLKFQEPLPPKDQ